MHYTKQNILLRKKKTEFRVPKFVHSTIWPGKSLEIQPEMTSYVNILIKCIVSLFKCLSLDRVRASIACECE